jgi:hypothetical protein
MRDYILDAMPFLIIGVMITILSFVGYLVASETSAYQEKCGALGGVVIHGKHKHDWACFNKSAIIEVE